MSSISFASCCLFSFYRLVSMVALGLSVLTTSGCASVVVNVDPNKRIQSPISTDSMNRIAFTHDRIAQVFGDEDSYTLQSDETRGQIFLKPTEENGDKPIPLTITTEHGKVQDMELTPQKISARTLILKSVGEHKPLSERKQRGERAAHWGITPFPPPGNTDYAHSMMAMGVDRVSQIIRVIKDVASREISEKDPYGEAPFPLKVPHLEVKGVQTVPHQGFLVSVYTLTNTTDQVYELVENAFGGPSVLAIAVEKRQIKPAESTRLFVVRSV